MQDSDKKVAPLKRVTLALKAGTTPDKRDVKIETPFEFIFGLGTDGLVPFERKLADLSEGDEISIHIKGEEIPSYFQHLALSPTNITKALKNYYLDVRVLKVTTADPKEVIGAMANMVHCADHCCGH
jgi:hypothetical protein